MKQNEVLESNKTLFYKQSLVDEHELTGLRFSIALLICKIKSRYIVCWLFNMAHL